ncbi:Nocturnin [Pseudolycoriella hygida]|uniref:Nocturnin n=1 Tax=Pseudolycoriella hygida TaxID=35572 RepID=A0A9Q0N093_9DIPT|nr:Nocturnin [Pseudolycoriella hygida]
MQSHGETLRKYGHCRRPSYGKAMPVSALLMNHSSPQHRRNESIARDGLSEDESPPTIFTLTEPNSQNSPQFTENDAKPDSKHFIENEQLDYSVSAENEFVFVSLKDTLSPSNDIETCSAMTELCNLLCDKSCTKVQMKTTDQSGDGTNEMKAHTNDRQKFLSSMIAESVTEAIDSQSLNITDEKNTESEVNDKLKVNEALVRTSMMTSPAARRRLAARKIEMEIDAADESATDSDYVPPKQLLMFLVRYSFSFIKISCQTFICKPIIR